MVGDLVKLQPPFPAKIHFLGCGEHEATDAHIIAMKQFATMYRGNLYKITDDVAVTIQELMSQHCK